MPPEAGARTVRVLVTGMGNPLGQNIHKALKMAKLPLRIWVMDANPFSAGLSWEADSVAPRVKAPDYIDEFAAFLKRNAIDIVFFGTEAEPAALRDRLDALSADIGTVFALDRKAVLDIADDKYLTAKALAEAGVDHPRSAVAEDEDAVRALMQEVGFPLIAKPRRGSAARGLFRLSSADSFKPELFQNCVIQECLLPDDQEYTVGIYRCRDGRTVATTVIRRELNFGLTYKGVLETRPQIQAYAVKVAEALGAAGSVNVQLRLTARGPVAFEVNPRFSSTTPIRAYFGVNEPALAIRELVLGERLDAVTARPGAVLRHWSEQYLELDEYELLSARDLSAWKDVDG
ncbi:ATP-grasp domain-containing protein [Bradyrhizobium sp. TZ2]